jgi:hypothetical protein
MPTTVLDDAPAIGDADEPTVLLTGTILPPGHPTPDAAPPPGRDRFGLGWWLTAPLRSAAWLTIAVCLAATLIPLGALWSTASPKRTALTGAATALVLAWHH